MRYFRSPLKSGERNGMFRTSRLSFYLGLAIILIATISGHTQDTPSTGNNFKFKNYTIFDGLPSTSIKSIVQDKKGFMWFGTRNGLSRFDGFTFENFQKNPDDSLSLSQNQVQSLFVDSHGILWIGTKYGLNRYMENLGFQRYFTDPNDAKTLSGNKVHSIAEDRSGNLWLGTDNGISTWNRDTDDFRRLLPDPHDDNSIGSNYVKKVFIDSNDIVWILTDTGIDRFDPRDQVFRRYVLNTMNASNNQKPIGAIYEDSKGHLWAGNEAGLWQYNKNTDAFNEYYGSNDLLKGISIRSILEDDDGNLLIGAYSGIYLENPEKNLTIRNKHVENDPYSIATNSVYSISRDKTGNLWFGTWASGIHYLDMSFDSFNHYTMSSGLSYPVVSSFVEDDKSNFWIGTEGGGLNYFDRATGTFRVYSSKSDNPYGLISEDNIQDVIADENGNLIIATFGGGLNYVDPSSKAMVFKHYRYSPWDETSISSDYIRTLYRDSKGRIWAGTSGGLNLFHPDTGSFERFREKSKSPNSTVLSIYETRDDKLMVGTSNGLGMVDGLNDQVDYDFFHEFNQAVNELVLCIIQDERGYYWLGTEGDGLVLMDDTFSIVKRYNNGDGLPSNIIYGILIDDLGKIWMSTHNGITRFDISTEKFENYDVNDGLQSNEFNFNAYTISSNGELIFGGVNGFNIFKPELTRKNEYLPPVIITDFKINEKPAALNTKNSPLSRPITETDHLQLNHDQSLFSFEFIALKYSQPGKVHYAYNLKGLSDEWLNIGNRRQVTFTNISPGTYTFQVKAGNSSGEWSDEITQVGITVLSPPWLTWWAKLCYALVILSIGAVIWRYSWLHRKDRHALEQAQMEREKEDELHELKLRFFTNVSHELRTPLTLILGPLDQLMSKKDSLQNGISEEIMLIHSNAKKLLRHVNNLLDFRKDEMGKLKLKSAKGDFVTFVKETSLSFKHQAESRQLEYSFVSESKSVPLYFDRDKMEIIIYNLLSNAFKFTPERGKITIRLYDSSKEDEDTPGFLCLSVEDNGAGIPQDKIGHIYDRFFQVDSNDMHSRGSGLGLVLTKKFVELHHGSIRVESAPGEGTRFVVRLPKGRKHLQPDEICRRYKSSEDLLSYGQKATTDHKRGQNKKEEVAVAKKDLPTLLIIEDNDDVRRFIISCFEHDYVIHEAADGGTGYEKATQLIPDIIISDVMMPEMDGITLCSALKKYVDTSHIPVILLTARTSVIFKKSGLETGADDFVTKPFTPEMLRLKVKNLLESRKRLHEHFVRNHLVNPKEIVMTSKDDEVLRKAMDCVEKHLSDSDFNVSMFISEMAMSRSVLFKKIKWLTGQSITEFIRTIRIKRAAQILLQDRLSISEVAYEVGFNDLKYFRTCFRRQFHASPSEYVTKNLQKTPEEKNQALTGH